MALWVIRERPLRISSLVRVRSALIVRPRRHVLAMNTETAASVSPADARSLVVQRSRARGGRRASPRPASRASRRVGRAEGLRVGWRFRPDDGLIWR